MNEKDVESKDFEWQEDIDVPLKHVTIRLLETTSKPTDKSHNQMIFRLVNHYHSCPCDKEHGC